MSCEIKGSSHEETEELHWSVEAIYNTKPQSLPLRAPYDPAQTPPPLPVGSGMMPRSAADIYITKPQRTPLRAPYDPAQSSASGCRRWSEVDAYV